MRQQHRWRVSRGWLIRLLIGIAAVFLGAYVTWRQFHVSREQLQLNLRTTAEQFRTARDQLVIAQQGQITERFTRAVDQLGSGQLVIRMGGIHALARIAKESPADVETIAEILCSYVWQHAPASEDDGPPGAVDAEAAMPLLVTRAADVQAVLAVLGRGLIRPDEQERLRLFGTDLRRANLSRAHLVDADLEGTRLGGAWMPEARLDGADLSRADLREANLAGASLEGAELTDAILCGAHVEGASLRDAILTGARLDGVVANQATMWPEGFEPQEMGVMVRTGHSSVWWKPDL